MTLKSKIVCKLVFGIFMFFAQFIAVSSHAQTQVNINDPTHLIQQGKIFTIKLVPADKKTSFYIVGNKVADLDFSQLSVDATLYGPKGLTQKIQLIKKEKHFEYAGDLKGEKIELKIHQPKPGESEKLELRLKAP